MTLPKLLTVADIARRVGRPTWWVRRRLKTLEREHPGSVTKHGRLYETTPARLVELYRQLGAAVLDSDVPEPDEAPACERCGELERQVVDLSERLAASMSDSKRR